MNPELALQQCRIVAPEKLSDRFIASGAFFQQDSPKIDNQVFIAYVFEITKPWFPSSKVLPTLLDTLQTSHTSLKPGPSIGDQFEQLLKTLNEQLNSISEGGETDWIGNLNGLIMVISGNELHFSQTGHCPAYILQKNRIRQITDDIPQEQEPHPLKTFSNLASGIIRHQDYILISNHELYNEISLDALRRVMNNSTPASSCLAIVKELKKERNLAVSSIIIKVVAPEEIESLKASEITEVILEDEMQSSFKKLQKKLAPWVAKTKEQSVRFSETGLRVAKSTGDTMKNTVGPAAKDLLQKGAEGANNLKGQVITQMNERKTAKTIDHRPVIEIILPKSKQGLIPEATKEFFNEETVIPADELDMESTQVLPSTPLHLSLLIRAKEWLKTPKHKKIAALGAALILISLTLITAWSRHTPLTTSTTSSQSESAIKQALELQKKAATAIELKQTVEASREIEQAQSALNSLSDLTEPQKKQAEGIWDDLTKSADSITATTRFSTPETSYTFKSPVQHVISTLPYVFGFANGSPILQRTGKGDASVINSTIPIADPNDSIVSIIKSNETDTAGYLLTRNSKVYRLLQNGFSSTLQPISLATGDFAPGDALASYLGNVYILDGKTGLLWKYSTTGTAYSKGVSVIDSTKYDIKKSISIAIDGSIFILKQDGSVLKFTSGQQDDFKLKEQPTLFSTMIQPKQIITSEDSQSVYILDAGISSGNHSNARVMEFSKSGNFIRQFAFPKNYTQVMSFDIDPKQKKLWILNGSEVSEFDI